MAAGIRTLSQFVDRVTRLHDGVDDDLFFRGHSKLSYFIEPGVERNIRRRENERELLYSLIAEHPSEFSEDQFTFDRLVRAQHYEVPTRLLDLTSNALIGLYFACADGTEEDGRVLVFHAPKLATKFFMSDCVSCASNLARLNSQEKHQINLAIKRVRRRYFDKNSSLITFSEADPTEYQKFIEELNQETAFHKLVQLIREEKPHFEAQIDPIDLQRPYVVHPKKSNARIVAQAGAFVLFGMRLKHGKLKVDGIEVSEILVKGKRKTAILNSLDKVGIHEGTVFPEMDKTAHRITAKYD